MAGTSTPEHMTPRSVPQILAPTSDVQRPMHCQIEAEAEPCPDCLPLLVAARLRTLRWERNKERRELARMTEENPALKISHHDASRVATAHLH